jgi:hypothetical protein
LKGSTAHQFILKKNFIRGYLSLNIIWFEINSGKIPIMLKTSDV